MIAVFATIIGFLMLLGVPTKGIGFFVMVGGVIALSLQK